jgi:hypothetical protein
MEEIWKDIPMYEGIYQVSNNGKVKSLSRFKISAKRTVKVHETILKGRLSGNAKGQYLAVSLSKMGLSKQYKIHQLVAMAFLNHKPCKYELIIDHINDIKTDNRLENLQIITQRENSYKTQGKYSSQYKGVSWAKSVNKWRARVRDKGKELVLGYFTNEIEAKKVYDIYCYKNFNLNCGS